MNSRRLMGSPPHGPRHITIPLRENAERIAAKLIVEWHSWVMNRRADHWLP
jgi:hypothetical protein